MLALLAAEITAVTGKSPGERYARTRSAQSAPRVRPHRRAGQPRRRRRAGQAVAGAGHARQLAGEPITDELTARRATTPPIGGLKVVTENAWFAARPSGTEDVYKIYAESFKGPEHLAQVQAEARDLVGATLGSQATAGA